MWGFGGLLEPEPRKVRLGQPKNIRVGGRARELFVVGGWLLFLRVLLFFVFLGLMFLLLPGVAAFVLGNVGDHSAHLSLSHSLEFSRGL